MQKPVSDIIQKEIDDYGRSLFGNEYPEILTRQSPQWTSIEWEKIKQFDSAVKKITGKLSDKQEQENNIDSKEIADSSSSLFNVEQEQKRENNIDSPSPEQLSQNSNPYFMDDDGYLCLRKKDSFIKLANFTACITKDITEDNGVELNRFFEITGNIKNKPLPVITVNAKNFSAMNWVKDFWGSDAVIYAGNGIKDHVRAAIELIPTQKEYITYYAHTGWRVKERELLFLTAKGAIGAIKENVTVRLSSDLQNRYALPLTIPNPEIEEKAIRASLSFLEIGKHEITIPLFLTAFLAPLTTVLDPMPNFTTYLYGESGSFKSTLAILLLSHFGKFKSLNQMPNFSYTANSLERISSTLKDVLMIVDDYHPSTNRNEANQSESTAQRLIRAFSNRTGRGRLNPDASQKKIYEPKGMLLITGEEMVSVQSTRARILSVEIKNGDIFTDRLTELQNNSELLPIAMTSYVKFLWKEMPIIKKDFDKEFRKLRTENLDKDKHSRLSDQTVFLLYTLDLIFKWTIEKKIINENRKNELLEIFMGIFFLQSEKQNNLIKNENPIDNAIEILGNLLTQGKIKIEDLNIPSKLLGGERGDLIGWHDEDCLYLMPKILLAKIREFYRNQNEYYSLSSHTFGKMLVNKGYLADIGKDGRIAIVKFINNKSIKVFKIIKNKVNL